MFRKWSKLMNGTQPLFLDAPGLKEPHHRHGTADQRQIVREGHRPADGTQRLRHARKPDIVKEPRGVCDQRVVFARIHPRLFRRRLVVLVPHVGRQVDSRCHVVTQTHRLGHAGPGGQHIGNHRIPRKIGRAAASGSESVLVIVGQFLARITGIRARELGHKRSNRHPVRLFVPHRRRVTV